MERKIFYHYTSIETLHKILDTNEDHIILRATHASFMNDPNEFDYAGSLMKESLEYYETNNNIVEKKSTHLSGNVGLFNTFAYIGGEPFVLSFSENKDDLSMWRAYGKDGNGVCIGFDMDTLVRYEKENTSFIRCIYNKTEIINDLLEYWEKNYNTIQITENEGLVTFGLNDVNLFNSVSRLGFAAKSESYKCEREWRLCQNERNNYMFRVNGNLIIPFVEHRFPKIIIKKIVIGPCLNSVQVEKGLNLFLEKIKFPKVAGLINRSDISYRQI